jgi:hypothetical protein
VDDIVTRLRHLASLHQPEKGGPYAGYAAEQCMAAMTEAADEIARLRAGADGWPVEEWELRGIHSALSDSLGDSDVTHIESDEELRDAEPVQWAAMRLAIILDRAAAPPASPAAPQSDLRKRPVAFRVKDFADGWILFTDEEAAVKEAERTGSKYEGLYVRDGKE